MRVLTVSPPSSGIPEWTFDVTNHRMHDANEFACVFWGASSIDELLGRDFSTDSNIVRKRLHDLYATASTMGPINEIWTLYPNNIPTTVLMQIRRAKADCAQKLLTFTVTETFEKLDGGMALRSLEVSRTSADIIYMCLLDGRVVWQNPSAQGCYGEANSEHSPRASLFDRVIDRDVAQALINRVQDDEDFSWETSVETKIGRQIHLLSARRGRDPVTGNTVAIVTEKNVTDLAAYQKFQETRNAELAAKVAERTKQLKLSEERYKLALSTAFIWDWDMREDKLFMSESFSDLLGYDRDEFQRLLAEQTISALVHHEDRASYDDELLRHTLEPFDPFLHEHRFLAKCGRAIWFRAQGQCILDEFGQPTRSVGLLTDITDRKELEEQLLAAQRMEAVGQLSGGIAHDFNNLLAVIQGNAELIEMLSPKAAEMTDEIVSAVRRGASLTADLLAFSRRQTLQPNVIPVGHVIAKMQKTLLRTLRENIVIQRGPDMNDLTVFADPNLLESAILNVALNARDAMPGGGTLSLAGRKLNAGQVKQDYGLDLPAMDYVAIVISDTGDGMSPDQMQRAFEPFFTTKPVGQGSGLGLSMVHGFARQSGGDCHVKSKLGQGTTVTIILPLAEGAMPMEKAQSPNAGKVGQSHHVHVIEDNASVLNAVTGMLKSLGFEVSSSLSGIEALEKLADKAPPDLYLVDVLLPDLNGYKVAHRILQQQAEVPVVMMSGYTGASPDQPAGLASDAPLVKKPFNRNELAKILVNAIENADTGP